MMEEMGPLVGEWKIGELVKLNRESIFDWEIKNDNFIYGGQGVSLPNEPIFDTLPKIAVLTSR